QPVHVVRSGHGGTRFVMASRPGGIPGGGADRLATVATRGRAMSFSNWLFGRRLATDEEGEQRVGVLAGIPMLGLDALGSAAYGPEAALTLLIPLGAAGLAYIGPISALIIALLLIVYFSYRQTI